MPEKADGCSTAGQKTRRGADGFDLIVTVLPAFVKRKLSDEAPDLCRHRSIFDLLRGWEAEAHTDAGAFCAFLSGSPCIFAQVVVILFGSMFTAEICARSSAGRASDF